ncbi:hypothetical protein SFR_4552 [Streptomyces sp. FR-008]|nr:hypothetical protein SFR_4552 [Streptomyces sp. FR-008]
MPRPGLPPGPFAPGEVDQPPDRVRAGRSGGTL